MSIYAAYIAEVGIWRMRTHGFGKAEIVPLIIEQKNWKLFVGSSVQRVQFQGVLLGSLVRQGGSIPS